MLSLDKLSKLFIISMLLIIIATPTIVSTYLQFNPKAATQDADADGFPDNIEIFLGTLSDDACGNPVDNSLPGSPSKAWPADLFTREGALKGFKKIDIQDITSFVAPIRRLDAKSGDANYNKRWDLNADNLIDNNDIDIVKGLMGRTCSDLVPTPSVSNPSPTSVAGHKPIFAYYYLWWSAKHWDTKLGPSYPFNTSPWPLPATLNTDGCGAVSLYPGNTLIDVPPARFGQDDPGRILQDVRTAAAAGLSGFIANWAGTGKIDQTMHDISYSERLDALVQAVNQVNAEGTPFKLWISYKASATIRPLDWIVGDLTYLVNKYAGNSAFDTRSGRQVLLWTGSRKYDLTTISAVSSQFRDNFFLVGDENWNTWGDGRAAYLDGDAYYWSTQNPYSNTSSFNNLKKLAVMVRTTPNPDGSQKLWFAPLIVGYNSQLNGGTTCVPRNNGATLRTIFEGNSASSPDAWAFISWNEIAENTHIEPTLQRWGRVYLDHLSALSSP